MGHVQVDIEICDSLSFGLLVCRRGCLRVEAVDTAGPRRRKLSLCLQHGLELGGVLAVRRIDGSCGQLLAGVAGMG